MKMKPRNQEAAPTEVATVEQHTEVALPAEWQTELAQQAREDTAQETTTLQSFSMRAGVLSYNGQPMPDNKMRVVVVASAFEKAMFINKFDPGNIVPPLCFALSANGEDMQAHDNSFKKQGDPDREGHFCEGCPQLEWGSDANSPSGRGKMCKEVRRLGLLPEDALRHGVEKSQPALLRVPVTSVANWSSYVHLLSATMKRPTWSVITEVRVVPDPKKQFQVLFEAVAPINDNALLTAIQSIRERTQKAVMTPYATMTEEQYKDVTDEKPKKKAKF
jgi:hypothetical protein